MNMLNYFKLFNELNLQLEEMYYLHNNLFYEEKCIVN